MFGYPCALADILLIEFALQYVAKSASGDDLVKYRCMLVISFSGLREMVSIQ
jgi:hypothetical protein